MTTTYSLENCESDIFCAIEELKNYISENNCKTIDIDISSLNFIDAIKVCILCSTFHFAKYIDGNIRWFVKDEIVKNQIKPMRLGNVEIEITKNSRMLAKMHRKAVLA